MIKIYFLITIIILFLINSVAYSNIRAKEKKLIHSGWERSDTEFISDSLSIIEDQPFDGMTLMVSFPNHDASLCAFSFEEAKQSDIQGQVDKLKSVQWQKFTDNFVYMFTGDVSCNADFNWYDDTQWNSIISNAGLVSKIVAECGLKGVFFDTENYNGVLHPWCIGDKYPGKTYNEIGAKVRQRGIEFITALQKEKPDIVILTTFFYGYLARDSADTYSPLARFFFDGMLKGLNKEAKIFDGVENAYWAVHTYHFPFWSEYTLRTVPASDRVAWDLRNKYLTNVGASAGLYCNYILGLDCEQEGIDCSSNLDSATKIKWLEHNVYNAMINNDEYVWLWNQGKSNWWRDFENKGAATDAINRARKKVRDHLPLGFTQENLDTSKTNEKGFYIVESFTYLNIFTNDGKSDYIEGDSIRLSVRSNDEWANYVRCYVNGQIIDQTAFAPFSYNLDTLKPGIYDIFVTGYSASNLLIESNYVTIQVYEEGTGSEEDKDESIEAEAYPNPLESDLLTINFNRSGNKAIEYNYSLADIYGRELLSSSTLSDIARLDLSAFTRGVYFLSIYNASSAASRIKIIRN